MKPLRHGKLLAALIAASVGGTWGCQSAQLPDPNDPKEVSPPKVAKLLHTQIQSAADDLNVRVANGQITDQQRLDLLSKRAGELIAEGDPMHCDPKDAWIYADLYITEKHFSDAIPLLKTAVEYATKAKDDDRRVNDSLRLARADIETGQISQGLDLAQQVIDSKPSDPGPLLPAILYEITPVAEGKGHDDQLVKLLQEAVQAHLTVKVDPTSDAGKAFNFAKPHHIHRAWEKIIFLYNQTGHPDKAKAAEDQEQKMMEQLTGGANVSV